MIWFALELLLVLQCLLLQLRLLRQSWQWLLLQKLETQLEQHQEQLLKHLALPVPLLHQELLAALRVLEALELRALQHRDSEQLVDILPTHLFLARTWQGIQQFVVDLNVLELEWCEM
jgi:hypothetical protein